MGLFLYVALALATLQRYKKNGIKRKTNGKYGVHLKLPLLLTPQGCQRRVHLCLLPSDNPCGIAWATI
jgi:hypothetical protein